MHTTMVVLAAGMGARFGGPKQLVPVGPNGETILDYNTHDAAAAGFDRVVVVTRPELREQVEAAVAAGVGRRTDTRVVLQTIPAGRGKPRGTADAVAVAAAAIDGPFGVANSDDLYGPGAFAAVRRALDDLDGAVVIGLPLPATVPPSGAVSRAILDHDSDGWVHGIVETHGITRGDDLDPSRYVSMNLWGFAQPVLDEIVEAASAFAADDRAGDAELFLPEVVGRLLDAGRLRVRLLVSPERWTGMTTVDDVRAVQADTATRWPSPLWT